MPTVHRSGLLAAFLLAAVFMAVNLATAERSPVVWTDEVMFADPAVNASLGRGFTTTAWLQPRETFFAGNAPLHSLVLIPWIEVFGVNATAVRSLNFALVLAVVAILVWTVKRLGLIRSNQVAFLLAILILCGDGVTYSYRSGRYDCLGMLWVALMFASQTLTRPLGRVLMIGPLCALVPWTGFQLIPYVGLLGLLLLILKGRSAIPDVVAAAFGGLVGLLLLAFLFREQGVLQEFRTTLFYIRGAQRSLAGMAWDFLRAPWVESSSVFLLLALIVAAMATRPIKQRTIVVIGLLVGVVVPCALGFTGKYVRYYAWMAYIPMAVAVASTIDASRSRTALSRTIFGLALIAAGVGFPARLALTILEWQARDPGPVRRLVESHVGPADWVYAEFEAYYPAKRLAGELFLPPYLGIIAVPGRERVPAAMTLEERARVNVLITKPDRRDLTLREFEGTWREVGHYAADPSSHSGLLARLHVGSKPYDLTVFRRVEGRKDSEITGDFGVLRR